MAAGRRRIADPGELYFFAQEFYWDFRSLAEGNLRWGFDRQKFAQAISEIERMQLTNTDRERLKTEADEQIRDGHVDASQMHDWLRNREANELFMMRERHRRIAVEQAEKQLRVPGDPDVLRALLAARNPDQIREICEDAFETIPVEVERGVIKEVEVPNWPIDAGSMFPRYLSQFAEQFIAAKKDSRFPRSNRETSRLKQLWFLSRALAGAVFGVHTRTAINLVGSKRPEEVFEESRAGKPERARTKRRKLS